MGFSAKKGKRRQLPSLHFHFTGKQVVHPPPRTSSLSPPLISFLSGILGTASTLSGPAVQLKKEKGS